MSPALNGSSAIRRFEDNDAIEIRDGITFEFYTGLPHIGTFSVKISFTISLPVNLPRLRQERELVHFHSVSCVGREPSSAETGTHPPKEKRRFLITTAEWRLRGRGAGPCVVTDAHCTFSVEDGAST